MLKVPPHRPSIRVDREMRVYLYRAAKMRELDRLLVDSAWRRQPVLIGTGSVIESDEISGWLTSWFGPPCCQTVATPFARQWEHCKGGKRFSACTSSSGQCMSGSSEMSCWDACQRLPCCI